MRSVCVLTVAGIILSASNPAHAEDRDPTDLPPIVSYGRFDDGTFVICRGSACAVVLAQLEERESELSMERTLVAEDGVSRDAFCEALEAQQPPNCSAANPPSTPGLDQGWKPNGCGTGGVTNLLADTALNLGYGDYYSGQIDAPFDGVSFKPSCDAHDACWGVAGARAVCDDNFDSSMRGACSALVNSSSRTICNGFAGAYFSAVAATDVGNDNYGNAVAARQCALWAHDMKSNQCDG